MASPIIRYSYISAIKKAVTDWSNATDINHAELRGQIREIVTESLFKPVLPPGVEIGTGQIIDSEGNCSAQTDIVIYNRNTLPPLLAGRTTGFFPVESCIYSIEVKSKLTATELKDSLAKLDRLRQLKYLPSFYPLNFLNPVGPACSLVIFALFAVDSDLSPEGKSEIDRYRELDPQANTSPKIPILCVVGRGYWRYEITETSRCWLHHPATEQYDELVDFISGVSNTIPREIWRKGLPNYGNYLSIERRVGPC